jgi:hypothetical protein
MQIALIAHDGKKEELLTLVAERLPILSSARLIATDTTGGLIEENFPCATSTASRSRPTRPPPLSASRRSPRARGSRPDISRAAGLAASASLRG